MSAYKSYSCQSLMDHMAYLFPFCRSITGSGTRRTLSYFESFLPILTRIKFPSGSSCFDWFIPDEWNIKDAYVVHLGTNMRYLLFSDSNLHVVGYSVPIDTTLDLNLLKDKIYTLPDQPDVVPYVTSYYSRAWGFCSSHHVKESLPSGTYQVKIDSSIKPGYLDLSHAIISGSRSDEIFFSSYVCHPSLANNELSGPVVLCALLDYVQKTYSNPTFTYRFLLCPETIGSIAYLSKYSQTLIQNVISGFNLSCVGDDLSYSYINSPYSNTLADDAIQSALIGLDNVVPYSYLERGSDERQYCSPGLNLPVVTFCRSKFGQYPQYHTSADDLDFVSESGLNGSLIVLKNIIDAFETCLYPRATHLCEPQLGRRGLYPSISTKVSVHPAKLRSDILAFSNGLNSIFAISTLLNEPLSHVTSELRLLMSHHLVESSTPLN